jgi:hypothetical protein
VTAPARIARLWLTALVVVAAAWTAAIAAPAGSAAPAAAPSDPTAALTARIETGLLYVSARCASGTKHGTAFLLGPRLMMVARRLVTDSKGRLCSTTVRQHGSGVEASIEESESHYSGPERTLPIADLIVAVLDKPLSGHAFAVARRSPGPGDELVTFGYAYAEGLSITTGRATLKQRTSGVPQLGLLFEDVPGGIGGPVVNEDGEVVGIVQRKPGQLTAISLDLAAFSLGDPKTLCSGIAVTQDSTICGKAGLPDDAAASRRYEGSAFRMRYPTGWRTVRAESDRGGYVDTTILDPRNPSWLLRVDYTPGIRAGTPRESAAPVLRALRRQAGYREIELRDVSFLGQKALRWEFVVREGGVLVRKVDLFFTDSRGTGWAVLFQAPVTDWEDAAPRLSGAVASLRLAVWDTPNER